MTAKEGALDNLSSAPFAEKKHTMKLNDENEKMYTCREVAEILGVSLTWIYILIRRDKMSCVMIGSRRMRIPQSAIKDFVDENRTRKTTAQRVVDNLSTTLCAVVLRR